MNKARERKKRARRLKSHRPSQGISAKLDGEESGPRVSAGGEQVPIDPGPSHRGSRHPRITPN